MAWQHHKGFVCFLGFECFANFLSFKDKKKLNVIEDYNREGGSIFYILQQ